MSKSIRWALGIAIAVMTLILTAFATPASAQQISEYGVKFGPTSASMALNENLDGQGSRIGFVLGGFALVNVGADSSFSLQPEILIVQKGMSWKSEGFFGDENKAMSLRLTYLELPILGRYTLPASVNAPARFYAVAGPSLAMRIGASVSSGEDDPAEYFDSKDFSFVVGGGARRGSLSAEVRASLGLLNVSTESELEAKNRGLTLLMGYALPR